jgi:hypothetical protein
VLGISPAFCVERPQGRGRRGVIQDLEDSGNSLA